MMKDYGIWAEFLLNQTEIERFREKFPKFYSQVYDENKIQTVVRSTFLIDKNGLLIRKWIDVKPFGHASSVKDQLNKSFNFEIGF